MPNGGRFVGSMNPRTARFLVGLLLIGFLAGCGVWSQRRVGDPALVSAGLARVDITPSFPVRMMGYAARANIPAPTNAAQRLFVRALAMGSGKSAALVLTIDNCILPAAVADEIRGRIQRRAGLAAGQIALTVTHTHSAPCLAGAAPNIFAKDMTAEDRESIDRYTRWFEDRAEEAGLAALADRKPARLDWGQGSAGFAKNRRTPGGPVDHALPVLRIQSPDGTLRGIWVSYACHCTTLEGNFNEHHGDWAGSAARQMETDHPGTVGLVSIGCGADANPDPRGSLPLADRHGLEIGKEASRVLGLKLQPITQAPVCVLQTIQLPFQTHFTRAEWESRATNSGIVGYHARKWLARIDQGNPPSPTLPYPVQTWRFGDQLAVVFLGGEVVVDYSLRLKSELDASRLWINGYANSVPCYIPSRRILREGGYEAETSLWYYDRPQKLAPEIEDLIVETVKGQLPQSWRSDPRAQDFPPSKSPAEALRSFRISDRFEIDLVASEPLIESPVAVDFGADGRLWVCEMYDYPSGLDGQGKPGGRVKVLSDTDGDGRFDRAEMVASDLPFPTGLMAWREGVLVCAAPDVVYLKPKAGGGGWERTVLLTGFATHNFQARVNGLRWGMDAWVYGSGGLFGGQIQVLATTTGKSPRTVGVRSCSNRDFRWRPDTGEFEPLAGVSQQGRVSDEFGNWFGNDNSTLLWHFPLPEHEARRNPHVAPPEPRAGSNRDGNRIYPVSRTLARFNDPHTANHLTSACGPEIYRDDRLGRGFAGNVFVCEPVHNLVRRAILSPEGPTFAARRAEEEVRSEFLASTDNWFRPVEVRTGPDGALWIVDFHRFVVEHPRWIPPERLRELDVRAGADQGRIYRVRLAQQPVRPLPKVRASSTDELVSRNLRSSNAVERDLAQRELLDRSTREPVGKLLATSGESAALTPPGAVVQRLYLEHNLSVLAPDKLSRAIRYSDPRVRRAAVALSARSPAVDPRGPNLMPEGLLGLADDPDSGVRYQLALTLGDYSQPEAGAALARIARRDAADSWTRAAVLSSVLGSPGSFYRELAREGVDQPGVRGYFEPFVRSLAGARDTLGLAGVASAMLGSDGASPRPFEFYTWLTVVTSQPGLLEKVMASLPSDSAARVERARRDAGALAAALVVSGDRADVALAALRHLGQLAATDATRRREFLQVATASLDPALRAEWNRSLSALAAPGIAVEMLAYWDALPIAVRGDFLGSILSRESWIESLLTAIEQGKVAPGELTPVQRRQLREHSTAAIARRSTALFPPPSADRAEIVGRYQTAATMVADVSRGAAHYERLCATCHRTRGRGSEVGPDLAPFRGKPFADFATAILNPNAALEPRFVAYTADLKDGRSWTGILRSETGNSLVLAMPGGATETVLRSELKSLVAAPQSLMPEGLEQGLSPQDLADLVGWIKSSPAPFGGASATEIEAARQRFAAMLPSGFTQPESSNETLRYPGWLGRLPLFYCRQSAGQARMAWRSRVPEPVEQRLKFRWPAAMGLMSQAPGKFVLRVHGDPMVEWDVSLEDRTWTGAGGKAVLRYTVLENNGEDSGGLLELEVDGRGLKAGSLAEFEVVGSSSNSQRWFGIYHLPGIN